MFKNSTRLTAIALVTVTSTAALFFSPASVAATATGTLLVSALVLSTCVVASTPVVFGNYTLGLVDNTGIISVTCTPDVLTYNVALGAGAATGATTSTRKLSLTTDSTKTLNYGLFRDAGHTQNWGSVGGTDTVPSTAATTTVAAVKTFTVNGEVPAGQVPAIGAYTDSVQITVNY